MRAILGALHITGKKGKWIAYIALLFLMCCAAHVRFGNHNEWMTCFTKKTENRFSMRIGIPRVARGNDLRRAPRSKQRGQQEMKLYRVLYSKSASHHMDG